jgi:WD40 repeat protein
LLWDASNGELIRTFEGHSGGINKVALSPDGGFVVSGSDDHMVRLWDARTGQLINTFDHSGWVSSVTFSADGKYVLSGGLGRILPDLRSEPCACLKLWNASKGSLVRAFDDQSVSSVAFSPDGAHILAGDRRAAKLWDMATGRLIRRFEGGAESVTPIAFSPDGKSMLSGGVSTAKLWDLATGQLIRVFNGHTNWIDAVAVSPDGTQLLSGSLDGTAKLWDVVTGGLIHTFGAHSGAIRTVAFSADQKHVLLGGDDKLKLWDVETGNLIRTFEEQTGVVSSAMFSLDGTDALSRSWDGTIRIWNVATGELKVTLLAAPRGEWVAITPDGFFGTSGKGAEDTLSIVRGFDVTTIEQVHQSLFNPDLVREALAGDPDGEVRKAAKVINLEKVLDSGPAPAVAITSHPKSSRSSSDLVTLQARVTDRGKGIGRIEWRVNGITAAVVNKPAGEGPDYPLTQQLALDLGDNTIDLVAYNASNLLASLPARTRIKFAGSSDTVKPRLHVLAIGINAYVDKGWRSPGSYDMLKFPPLSLAVSDARSRAAALRKAGAGQYAKVRVTEALDTGATAARLQQIIERMASEINPRDTFVLFAAAHGTSQNGRFISSRRTMRGARTPPHCRSEPLARTACGIGSRIRLRRRR